MSWISRSDLVKNGVSPDAIFTDTDGGWVFTMLMVGFKGLALILLLPQYGYPNLLALLGYSVAAFAVGPELIRQED